MLSCGIDLIEFQRFEKYLQQRDPVDPFLKMVFTQEEISRNFALNQHICFPAGFTCKEAVFKAFGQSWTNSPIDWKEIELLFHPGRQSYSVHFSGYASQLYGRMAINDMACSFESTPDYVLF